MDGHPLIRALHVPVATGRRVEDLPTGCDDGPDVQEVKAMSSGMEQVPAPRRAPRESLDEQARRKGARPLRSADELRNEEVWESEEELAEFLEYLDVARHAGSV